MNLGFEGQKNCVRTLVVPGIVNIVDLMSLGV